MTPRLTVNQTRHILSTVKIKRKKPGPKPLPAERQTTTFGCNVLATLHAFYKRQCTETEQAKVRQDTRIAFERAVLRLQGGRLIASDDKSN